MIFIIKNDYGQYFTPRHVADFMVSLLSSETNEAILEPSAGNGVFLDALRDAGYVNTLGIEIDDRLTQDPDHKIIHGSFIGWKPETKVKAIIGNPPYIRWKNLDIALQDEIKQHHLWGKLFNSLSDYLNVFIANSIEHLLPGGELIFITPSFWMHTKHAEPLREWMLAQGQITDIVDFGENSVFPKVSSSIVIFRFQKNIVDSLVEKGTRYIQYIGPKKVPDLLDASDSHQFSTDYIPAFAPRKHWTLANAEVQSQIEQLERRAARRDDTVLFNDYASHATLGEYVDVANGMVSGLDAAFRLSDSELSLLTDDELKAARPVAKARDLGYLGRNSLSYYLDLPLGLQEEDLQRDYPHIFHKLQPYKEKLLERYSYDREIPYWEWAFKRSEKFITSAVPKIFVPCKERMTNKETARFAYVESGIVATQDVTVIAPKGQARESLEYILAYLSTFQVSQWVRVKGLMRGGVAEFSEKPISEIPFRSIDWGSHREIVVHDEITRLVKEHFDEKESVRKDLVLRISEMFDELG